MYIHQIYNNFILHIYSQYLNLRRYMYSIHIDKTKQETGGAVVETEMSVVSPTAMNKVVMEVTKVATSRWKYGPFKISNMAVVSASINGGSSPEITISFQGSSSTLTCPLNECSMTAPNAATHVYFTVKANKKRRKTASATFKYSRDNQNEVALVALEGVAAA